MARFFFLFLLLCAVALEGTEISIALISDGSSPFFESISASYAGEITELLEPEFLPKFIKLEGNFDEPTIEQVVEAALVDEAIDMVVTTGPVGSDFLAKKHDLPKPSFATSIIDSQLQGLPFDEGASGVQNLNYFETKQNLAADFLSFRRITPFKRMAVLLDGFTIAAMPELKPYIIKVAKELQLEPTIVLIGNSGEEALGKIPANTEAVFVTPLPRLSEREISTLLQGLAERKIPSFSSIGQGYIDKGILASTVSDNEVLSLSRRVALHIQGAALGDSLAEMPVVIASDSVLEIDMKVAGEIGISPPFDLLLDAKLLHANEVEGGRPLTLVAAIAEGLQNNPRLAAEYEKIEIGYQDLQKARAQLNAQIDIGTLGRIIDNDRAIINFGLEPAGAAFATIEGRQVLYSNRLKGKVTIEQYLQYARQQGFLSKKLDLILAISRAYFNLLRAQTVLNIQRDNLRLTAYNLRVAKQRVDVGTARLTEVYRWESELAKSQTAVNEATAIARNAEVALNELLNTCQETKIIPEKVGLNSKIWTAEPDWIEANLNTPDKLSRYKDYMVEKGWVLSPELKEVNDLIYASNERYNVANRQFYTPDLFLSGALRQRYAQKGAGITSLYADESDWNVALRLNFPLYAGGEKIAEKRQARSQLRQLEFRQNEVRDAVEKNIRQAINKSAASYSNIELSKTASTTARKNLDLVLEAYSQGTVNILDLLDAQNAALVAELESANSIYNFLIDLVTAQRAVGEFDFLLSPEEKSCNLYRLEQYFANEKMD